MTESVDFQATLNALRADGAAERDPVRFAYLDAGGDKVPAPAKVAAPAQPAPANPAPAKAAPAEASAAADSPAKVRASVPEAAAAAADRPSASRTKPARPAAAKKTEFDEPVVW